MPKTPFTGLPTRKQILDFIAQSDAPAGKREIARAFGLKGNEKIALKALLKDIQKRLNDVRSPFRTAEKFGIEDIIDPRDTRPLLCEFVDHAYRVLEPGPVAKGWRC